jgi:glyoxylase-like metal-dependent hydrolase (beta-lactamase superfamily II)
MKFGDFELFVVSDGLFRLDGGAMFGVVPKVLWQKTDPANGSNRILLGLNCLLIKSKSDIVLVDTGIGTLHDEKFITMFGVDKSGGDLLQGLALIGLKPQDVTKVILTHLHFDHCGGNCFENDEGKIVPTFPEATYFVQQGELEYAKRPDARSRGSYLSKFWEPVAAAGQLEIISGNQEILPGVELYVTGGHTRDHQIVKIHSNGKTACFLADLVPTSSHLKTAYVMAYDLYPRTTMEVKERVLKQALEENWLLFFEHAPRIKAGYLTEVDGKLQVEKFAVE